MGFVMVIFNNIGGLGSRHSAICYYQINFWLYNLICGHGFIKWGCFLNFIGGHVFSSPKLNIGCKGLCLCNAICGHGLHYSYLLRHSVNPIPTDEIWNGTSPFYFYTIGGHEFHYWAIFNDIGGQCMVQSI